MLSLLSEDSLFLGAELPLGQKKQQEMNRRLNRRPNFPTGDKAENRRFEQEI